MSLPPTLTPLHLYAGIPNTTRGEPTHISADPTGLTDNIVYASGRLAVIRSISNPLSTLVFSAHTAPVTAVKFSPDATLVASADAHGIIRLWNPTTALQYKAQIDAMSGPILDLAFDKTAKFLVCAGEGRGAFAKLVKIPTGASAGVCLGHTKRCLACDVGKAGIVTASEDMSVGVFKGPPVREIDIPRFLTLHTAFVNDLRFSPDQRFLAVASSDKKISILDGNDMNVLIVLEGHSASVTGLAWMGNDFLLSSGNDKTCKMWSVPQGECLWTTLFGKTVSDMQVGCAVVKKGRQFVSLSLKGELSVCDQETHQINSILRGHSKQIVALATVAGKIYTADYSGLMVAWDDAVGSSHLAFNGKSPPSTACSIDANDHIVASVGQDGKIFITPTTSLTYAKPITVKGGGVAIAVPALTSASFSAIMVNETRIVAIDAAGETVIAEMKFGNADTPCSVAVSADAALIAVGLQVAGEAGELHFYVLNGSSFNLVGAPIRMQSPPNRIAFSPDGCLIAVGEKSRRVRIYDATSRQTITGGGIVHTARVDAICFSQDSSLVASGGMDGSVALWPVHSEEEPLRVKMAHRNGVTGIAFTSSASLVTSGGDCCMRSWTI